MALYGCHLSQGSEALKVKTSVMIHDTWNSFKHNSLLLPAPCFIGLDVWWCFSGAHWNWLNHSLLQTVSLLLRFDGSTVSSNGWNHGL